MINYNKYLINLKLNPKFSALIFIWSVRLAPALGEERSYNSQRSSLHQNSVLKQFKPSPAATV